MIQPSPTKPNAIAQPSNFTSSLPAKITGIVFWGIVLVGLLTAVIMLHGREAELRERYALGASGLNQYFSRLLGDSSPPPAWYTAHLKAAAVDLQKPLGFDAIELIVGSEVYSVGEINSTQTTIRQTLPPVSGRPTVTIITRFPAVIAAVNAERKQILVSLGLMLFAFGLILQQIMKKLLTAPFLQMIATAHQFTGDHRARFDEERNDEFGFLGKFINQALNSIVEKQDELENALADIRRSEKALFSEKERAEVTLRSIADAVITTDSAGRVTYMNPVAEQLTGWRNEQAFGNPINGIVSFIHEENHNHLQNPVEKCIAENMTETLVTHAAMVCRNGDEVSAEATAAPMHNNTGVVMGAVIVIQDVSHARRLSHQLSYQASHDALTGLLNRRKFEERLEQALQKCWDEDRQHAICYIDLDEFKIVNDTCGHMAGDELLRQLSSVLQESIREGDTLARLGGDEFGVLLENCSLEQAKKVANKLLSAVSQFRFLWQDKTFNVGASIGLASITSDSEDLASLLSAADLACYAAKEAGRSRIHVYEPADNALAQQHGEMHWVNQIAQALEENRFVLYRQPIVAINGDPDRPQISEILVSMSTPEGKLIEPDAFIPAAERYNYMTNIDKWVIRNSFAPLNELAHAEGAQGSQIFTINLSGASLTDDDFLAFILAEAIANNVSLSSICFEITETVVIGNITQAMSFMKKLRAEGCKFALDDFGSGLSSFAYLKNLSVDYLKINGSFIRDLVNDPVDRAMVDAIVNVADIMGVETIAERVENQATLDILKQIGVTYAQGFHIGKPALLSPNSSASVSSLASR